MTLDVVVPTFNRRDLLRSTVLSLLRAPIPDTLQVSIFVIDNNSEDNTSDTVRELQRQASCPLHYVREWSQGSSHARNAGIRASHGDLIGFVDDDEEVDADWFHVIAREFQDETVHYIGGPCLAKWEVPAPNWLPPGYHSVIGAIPPKPRGRYGHNHPGMLNGGNAVLRRGVFDRVGLYAGHLGRGAKGLGSEEDAELFQRIQRAEIGGLYVPDLIIHHYVPRARLTRRYHRRWALGRAISQGILHRESRDPVAHVLGIPRHRIGRAVQGAVAFPRHCLRKGGKGQAFADELATWDLLGFIHGRYFARLDAPVARRTDFDVQSFGNPALH